MREKQSVLDLIRMRGPSTVNQLSSVAKEQSYLIGAFLTELLADKSVRVTSFKVGSAPLYYLPNQAHRLEQFVRCLNEKDRKTVELLRERKVIKDKGQEPLLRVSMRNLPDFAIPFEATKDGETHLYFRYYLVPEEEARAQAEGRVVKPVEHKQFITMPQPSERTPAQAPQQSPPMHDVHAPSTASPEPAQQATARPPYEPLQPAPRAMQPSHGPPEKQTKQAVLEQSAERSRPQKKQPRPKKQETSEFLERMLQYFRKQDIEVVSHELIRKAEIDFVVRIPSVMGQLTYSCVAKDKAKLSDADIAAAYAKAASRKLPALIVTSGDLTAAAKTAIEKTYTHLVVKRL